MSLRAEAGKTYTFHKYFAVFTDNDSSRGPIVEAAVEAVQQARSLGYEELPREAQCQMAGEVEP